MLEYDKDVPFYNELEKLTTNTSAKEQRVSVAEKKFTYTESDDWIELPRYDLMLNENVDYATIFDKLFASDDNDNAVMIPDVLPNVSQGDTTRTHRRNKIFVRNFIGLCIWKNMNGDGSPMVKKNTFNHEKSPKNVKDFQRHLTIL